MCTTTPVEYAIAGPDKQWCIIVLLFIFFRKKCEQEIVNNF